MIPSSIESRYNNTVLDGLYILYNGELRYTNGFGGDKKGDKGSSYAVRG